MIQKVVACPPNIKLKSNLFIEGVGNVVCEDRGVAIKGKRLDLWVGIGDAGYNNIGKGSSKATSVYLLP